MVDLNNVTLVCVTSHIHIPFAIRALLYSLKGIRFNSVKLFVDQDCSRHLDKRKPIEIVSVKRIETSSSHSLFMLQELHKYIDTEYILNVEHDGFVMNPHLWSDEFFEYDYIGAPWADNRSTFIRIGNFGFSLTKNQFLKDISQLPNCVFDKYVSYRKLGMFENDVFIAKDLYKMSMDGSFRTFKIPNLETALRFSIERRIPEYPKWSRSESFGFHGMFYNPHAFLLKEIDGAFYEDIRNRYS